MIALCISFLIALGTINAAQQDQATLHAELALHILSEYAAHDARTASFCAGLPAVSELHAQDIKMLVLAAHTALTQAAEQGISLNLSAEVREAFTALLDIYFPAEEHFQTVCTKCNKPVAPALAHFPPVFDPDRRPSSCVCQSLLVYNNTDTGTLSVHSTGTFDTDVSIGTDLTVDNLVYELGKTVSPDNVLYVQKSTITSPNQFNTITAALNAITTNSATNPFVILVTPGIFVEPTLQMKPFVTLKGSGGATTIIQTSSPNQHVIIGAPSTVIRDVLITGATGSGFAGISHTASGTCIVLDCIFGSNNSLIKMLNAQPWSILVMSRIQISNIIQFSYDQYCEQICLSDSTDV